MAEHPRPPLTGRPWLSLDGTWQHAVTRDDARPASYDGPIRVPFSPEAPLSGVGRQLLPDERLWYSRTFTAPPADRTLLHFGAVDQSCTVWVDGVEVGGHVGGYLPFTLDVTAALGTGPGARSEHELVVRVRDLSETGWHARGKQRLDRGEIWYSAQSGIWQTVWLEAVPASYVAEVLLVAELERPGDDALVVTVEPAGDPGSATATVRVAGAETEVPVGTPTRIPVPGAARWSPERPVLHNVEVTYGADRVASYAALRTVGVGTDPAGHRRLLLNGAAYPHVGVLDQGYWPDGLMTPPSEAAMLADLERVKDLGFTMVRKHAKVEPLRWYSHCDRLGLLVWQDVVNGGEHYSSTLTRRVRDRIRVPDRLHRLYGRGSREGREEFLGEVDATVQLLRGHPSVVAWTPFNEAWGQFDSVAVAERVRRLDPTRLVHATSGWSDHGGGDVRSFHRYLEPFTMPDSGPRSRPWPGRRDRRAVALTEYGGFGLAVPGHVWGATEFDYRHFADAASLAAAFTELHEHLAAQCRAGLSATVWTQLSDVEDELNGLVTYDREVAKIDADVVRRATALLREAMLGR